MLDRAGSRRAGAALPIAKARIKVADFDAVLAVDAEDRDVAFKIPLTPGPVDLQTWFYDREGNEICGAYFVYVERR